MDPWLNVPTLPATVLPFFIFFARVADVSIGTLRLVVVARGLRTAASLLGFLEVFIWLMAISQVLQNLTGIVSILAYCSGFAAGTYVGMTIQRRLTFGHSLVRIIIPGGGGELVAELQRRGHRVTKLAGEGVRGPVDVVFSVADGRHLRDILSLLKKEWPESFYSVEDVRAVREFNGGNVPFGRNRNLLQPFLWFRKGK